MPPDSTQYLYPYPLFPLIYGYTRVRNRSLQHHPAVLSGSPANRAAPMHYSIRVLGPASLVGMSMRAVCRVFMPPATLGLNLNRAVANFEIVF